MNTRQILTLFYEVRLSARASIGLGVTRRTIERWLAGKPEMSERAMVGLLDGIANRRKYVRLIYRHRVTRAEAWERRRQGQLTELEQLLRGKLARPKRVRRHNLFRKQG